MLSKLLITSNRNRRPEDLDEDSAFSNKSVSGDGYIHDLYNWTLSGDDSSDEEVSAIMIRSQLDELHHRTVGLSLSNKDPAK